MANDGYLALLLHAHLPYVRHPEHERFLEEDWLFEAITDCYLPMLEVLAGLGRDGIRCRITLGLTPTLLGMLSDDLLANRYLHHLDLMVELADKEVSRTRNDRRFHRLARMYHQRYENARRLFRDHYGRDLIGAFCAQRDEGRLEVVTSAATHAFLPVLADHPLAVAAQIRMGVHSHREALGRRPPGIWLPECGYFEGLEAWLAQSNLHYFFTETHGILNASPRPLYGVYKPVLTPAGPAVFGRDPQSSRQVWSAEVGYPGDSVYRDFYRDIGYDLDPDYLRPYLQPDGQRKSTGIKYHRITGGTGSKQPYEPEDAARRARVHAAHFLDQREAQLRMLRDAAAGSAPVVVCPYDAELFGHWWFEGPAFLDALFRNQAARPRTFTFVTPSEYLVAHPVHQVALPAASSWGQDGHRGVWLEESNDWIYRHLHWAAGEMVSLAAERPHARGVERRLLDQAARELMLAQASDWAFIMKTGTAVTYAVRRTREHLLAFQRLRGQVLSGRNDEAALVDLESRNRIFPWMDYRVYREDYQQAQA